MNEKELFDKINREAELKVPDTYGKILNAAMAEGILEEADENAAVYSEGNTVVLGGVNKKGVAITTCAAVASICLAIALPIALSPNGAHNPGITLELGDDYAIGAVSTAKLAESYLVEADEEAGAKGLHVKAASLAVNPDEFGIERYISEFDNYYYACNSFFGEKPVTVEYVENNDTKYDNYIQVSGKFSNGDVAHYSMYYSEARILDDTTVTGSEVKYYLEGMLYLNDKHYSMYGERIYTDSTKTKEKSLSLSAYPVNDNKNSRVDMSVEYGDKGSVKKYSFTVVKNGNTISESVLSFPDKAAYAIEFNGDDGEREGKFTVHHPEEGSASLLVGYEIGNLTSEFRVKATAGKLERVLAPDGLVYAENGDGTYSIKGYDKRKTMPKELTLPDEFEGKKIVKIASSAFKDCLDIEKVVVPEGITEISDFAFHGCEKINEIVLPKTLTKIEVCALSGCISLNEIKLPENLVNLGSQVFYGCTSLVDIKIPEKVETLGMELFHNCTGLKTVSIPASVNSIGRGIFSGTAVETITVADANQYYYVDGGCLIEKATKTVLGGSIVFTIPNDATAIDEYAFAYCYHLTDLTLPASVKQIGSLAFENSTLQSIVMPGVQKIGFAAFSGSTVSNVELSEALTTIGDNIFAECKNLTALNLPASLTSIGINTVVSCYSLQSITVASGNPVYFSSGNCVIELKTGKLVFGCSTSVIPEYGVSEIGDAAFSGNKNLKEITIPSTVERIGAMAFGYTGLTSILIPDSVTFIDIYAFDGCSSLSDVTLSANLHTIRAGAFENCTALKSIIIPDSVTELGQYAFAGCTALESIKIPTYVETISQKAFEDCTSLQSVTLSLQITAIEDQAFYACHSLTEINFAGTMDEWQAITKGDGWAWDTGDLKVKCTDGTLDKDGNLI